MPVTPTYPGVYIEELPSGVRTITGVSTSVAAFVDYFKAGPIDEPVQVFNMGDFNRVFGGLDTASEASYAIQQFFLNGGSEAWVVRTVSGGAQANVIIRGTIGGGPALTVSANNKGAWGNALRVTIDHDTTDPATLFNLTVTEQPDEAGGATGGRSEVFRNLSTDSTHPRFVDKVINDKRSGSKLISLETSGAALPMQNGTVSGDLSAFPAITKDKPAVDATIGTLGTFTAQLNDKPKKLTEARSLLEGAIRAANPGEAAFASATVEIVNSRLRVLAGPVASTSLVTFSASGTDPTVSELQLGDPPATAFTGLISGDLSTFPALTAGTPEVDVTIGAEGPFTATFSAQPSSLATARTELEDAIQGADASDEFKEARVATYEAGGEARLVIIAGVSGAAVTVTASAGDPDTAGELQLAGAEAARGIVSGDLTPFPALTAATPMVDVTIGGAGPRTATLDPALGSLATARTSLQAAIRALDPTPAFANARVATYEAGGEARLVVLAGSPGDAVVFSPAPADSTSINELKLTTTAGATVNLQQYALGAGAAVANTAQGAGTAGTNGSPPNGSELRGVPDEKTGIYALEDVDLFNILCIPRTAKISGPNALPEIDANAVISAAIKYCEERRAFFIVDTPDGIRTPQDVKGWLQDTSALSQSSAKNAALYYPRVEIADPENQGRLRSCGASGTVAGLYARTDAARGVWKAPAGIDATLTGAQAVTYTLTDAENGTLNPLGINCLRGFPVYGAVVWGARTLHGADQRASEWKYLPVRRLVLFIEESLYRGTKWVVFEPNDEPLWAQIRLNVGAFMQILFRQGAFQGATPREAYFVKCDKETTTQNDINLGIVNIVVGFAPLKPAEFVIIKIQQIAGEIQT